MSGPDRDGCGEKGSHWNARVGRVAWTLLALALLAVAPVRAAVKQEPRPFAGSGVFVVTWADPAPGAPGEASPGFLLIPDGGEPVELLLDPELLRRQGGAGAIDMRRVAVSGARTRVRGGAVRVESLRPESPELIPGPSAPHGWAVLLCRFAGSSPGAPIMSPARFETLMTAEGLGMTHFWREASGGATDISGSAVYGWFDLGRPRDAYLRDPARSADTRNFDAQQAARDCAVAADADVFFPDFDGVLFAFDRDIGGFSRTGAAALDLDGVRRSYRAAWLPPRAYEDPAALAHAMGHAYGLPHSSTPQREAGEGGWGAMTLNGACGGFNPGLGCLADPLIAWHEDLAGWMAPEVRYTVPAGANRQTAILAPAGDPHLGRGAYRMALVPLAGSGREFYTVEVRRPSGQDEPGDTGGGVLIHRVDTARRDRQALVVEPGAQAAEESSSSLWQPGETFRDADNGITFSIGSESEGRFEVTFWRGPVSGACGSAPGTLQGLPEDSRQTSWQETKAIVARLRDRAAGGGEPVLRPVAGQTVFFELDWLARGNPGNSVPVKLFLDGQEFCACDEVVPAGAPTRVRSSCASGWQAIEGRHTVRWVVGGTDASALAGSTESTITQIILVAPVNNDCSSPVVITSIPFTETIDTSSATSPGPDPTPPCGNGSSARSVWYRFTAPGSGSVTVDTVGSDYDTILSTWSGSCGSLTMVPGGCNDDISPSIAESSVTLSVTTGVTYLFMVSAFNGDGGSLSLNLTFAGPPPNDTCETATELRSPAAVSAFTAPAGGLDGPIPPCGNGSKAKSVWYRFTASGPGTLVVDTFGSNYDTILSAWTGSCTALSALAGACNDDSGGQQSRLDIPLTGIRTIYFMVTAAANDGGSLMANLEFRPSAGEVPDGTSGAPLVVTPAAGGNITLSWSRSCMELESDYAIYDGTIGSFTSHAPLQCSTSGATSVTITPSAGDRYYLVVPRTGFFEGSYGRRSDGAQRPAATAACLPQAIGACAPACAHDKCVSGAALNSACDPVVSELCALDSFCCSTTWDNVCVSEVRTRARNLTCPESAGSCSHTLCSTGAALVSGCDSAKVNPSCTAAICVATPACCTTTWDAACVAQVNSVCGYDCN